MVQQSVSNKILAQCGERGKRYLNNIEPGKITYIDTLFMLGHFTNQKLYTFANNIGDYLYI